MVINAPLEISARLLPSVRIGRDSWVSWDLASGIGYIDAPGLSHEVNDMHPGLSGRTGTAEERVRACLGALCSFLGACAESRGYGTRNCGDPMRGENSDLFPAEVGEWAEANSDELAMVGMELE